MPEADREREINLDKWIGGAIIGGGRFRIELDPCDMNLRNEQED